MAIATKKKSTFKATFEEAWGAIKALAEAQKRTEDVQQQTEAALKETQASVRETQKAQRKTEKFLVELGGNLDKANGNFNNKWGSFLENFVSGNLVDLLRDRGIKVRRINKNVLVYRKDGSIKAEYDLVALNGTEAVVIEVKTTLSGEDVKKFLGKLKDFRENCPKLAWNRAIYGGIAYLGIADDSRKQEIQEVAKISPNEYAKREGLFLIQSPGGDAKVSIIVNEKNFRPKAF